VLAANHVSNIEPWALGLPLFPKRFLRFMAKSELYWKPLGYLLDAGGAFPVHRGEGDVEAIETAVERFPGAVLVPLSAFDAATIPAPPGSEIVFACRSGRRSATASFGTETPRLVASVYGGY